MSLLKSAGLKNLYLRAERHLAVMIKWRRDRRSLPLTKAHFPLYKLIHLQYHKKLGKFPDLVGCRELNEKIQWLKLFDQDRLLIQCSDKILVRDYINERVGHQYLVQLYQVHDRYSEIDFYSLPQSFVIKTNHDSGSVILVRHKNELDRGKAEEKINIALSRPYGAGKGEWQYSHIRRKVLVEEYLEPENDSPPPDYKFHCLNGKVVWLQYIYGRGQSTKEQLLDREAKSFGVSLSPKFALGDDFVKPACWEEMISVAEKMAAGFKYVRVDLFCVRNRIYVGELTFFPRGGYYIGDGQKFFGSLMDFDRSAAKPLFSLS